MKRKKFIESKVNDSKAYRTAINYACELAQEDDNVKRIVLLILKKNSCPDSLEEVLGHDNVKRLVKGDYLSGLSVPLIMKTPKTYIGSFDGNVSDIVIACLLNSEDLFVIDDKYDVRYTISIPWQRKDIKKWIRRWQPDEITGQELIESDFLPEPSGVAKTALDRLTSSINNDNRLSHPDDEKNAKIFMTALKRYESELNSEVIASYLVKSLNWKYKHAKEIEKMIDTLNNGGHLIHYIQKDLKGLYESWKISTKAIM